MRTQKNPTSYTLLLLLVLLVFTPAHAQEDFANLKAQGISYYKRGEYERAKEFFIQAAKIRREAEVYKYLADIYRRQGDTEYADKLAEKARELENPVATAPKIPASTKDQTPPTIELISPLLTRGLSVIKIPETKTRIAGRAIDASGISEVTVRGIPASLDSEGNFVAEIGLKIGNNPITIVATDIYGNRATKEFTLKREPQAGSSAEAVTPGSSLGNPGKFYALVIGINAYKKPGVPPLETAVGDAEEVGRALKDDYGFEVKMLLNASRNEILGAMSEYRRKLEAEANLLIYYAGHGYFDKQADKGYWLPVDAEQDNPANWVSADDLTTTLRAIPARHILVIADSCYSGTLTRDAPIRVGLLTERNRLLAKMLASSSRTVMASGGNEPVADGGGGKHSIFAAALLKGLKIIDDDAFTADELFLRYVRQQVAGRADQKPQYDAILKSGHDGGEFVFIRRKK